eukprot:TRINITY_DN10270_c0_g1_i1.p1 TRINITY_DN10270_c0_g1~~TRINITY_DN10270_c0_g1_i1.p1  ORF type:complete len:459 (+),score=218.40 TRINITY_DN10270_c0_g1_i1:78-1454(+)
MAEAKRRAPAGTAREALNAKMTQMEALRVESLLGEACERLQLLALLTHENPDAAAADPDGSGPVVETGVGAILENQKRMEQRYDELLTATAKKKINPLDPQLDVGCFASIDDQEQRQQQEELEAVSKHLKEYSRDLCRQLKENPNDSNNWNKVVNGRSELCSTLQQCIRELRSNASGSGGHKQQPEDGLLLDDGGSQHSDSQRSGPSGAGLGATASYETFAVKVIDEQNEQIWADEIVKREKETNQNVKTLQNEVAIERGLKERDLEERQQQLSELKIKVRQKRQEHTQHYEQTKGETEARAEAQARKSKNRQRELRERIDIISELLEIEKQVSKELRQHLERKTEQVSGMAKGWHEKQARCQRETEEWYQNCKNEMEKTEDALHKTQEQLERERRQCAERRRDRELKSNRKKHAEDEQRSRWCASTRLQAAFKGYMVRKDLLTNTKKGRKSKGKKNK